MSTATQPWAAGRRGGLMVCGVTSDAGKTTVVAGLCRLLARAGVRVAPFKAQNMSLNSVVTRAGHEISRAQDFQAFAAGVDAEVAMNPVLLKPTTDHSSQLVVLGRPVEVLSAAEYHQCQADLLPVVLDALADLRARYDVVLLEGAGSPAELNLLDRDIANLRVALHAGVPALVVGDIDRGGVFAGLYGTVSLLPDAMRTLVRGFVINKLRGDPALLGDGCALLEARCGIPILGVLPWFERPLLDAEDSLALRASSPGRPPVADTVDVVVVALPRIANFTDVDPLRVEPGVELRFVDQTSSWGRPDLVIVPGTKATVDDLAWLRRRGLDQRLATSDATVLGICGGYQMMGRHLDDPVESRVGSVEGLGLLPVVTGFGPDKVIRRRAGRAWDAPVEGYQLHHGRVSPEGGEPFVVLDDDGSVAVDGVQCGARLGTTLHGLLDGDEFRAALLTEVAARAGKHFVPAGICFAAERAEHVDELADVLAAHLDLDAVARLVTEGCPPG
jgi:adenosylcobyric acid synthase